MTDRFRCAVAASARGEPRFATASTVRRWLLVEQPGPWGSDALLESRMASATGSALADLGKRLRARVLLIRRCHGRSDDQTTVFAAVSGVGVRWLESFRVDAPEDVLHLDLGGLADGRSVGGTTETEPVLLVCTNGRHDPCCAEFGRPIAGALEAAFGDRVWEVSHIGGDRFAGNVVVLPDGLYYGGLDPVGAVAAMNAYARGTITLDTYRGRSAYPFVVQAAEHFLRTARGLHGVDDLRWTDRQRLSEDRWRVRFRTPVGDIDIEVSMTRHTDAHRLTCHATRTAHPPRFELIGMRAVRD